MHRSFIFYLLASTLPAWQVGICQPGTLQSEVRMTKLSNCNNVTALKWNLQNVTISYWYPRSYLNAILNVTEETKKIKKVIVHVDRCNDQGFNCEDFQTWYFDNFCPMLNWKDQIWSGLSDSVHPSFRCPIKRALYQVQNATYNFNAVTKWYSDFAKYHWRMTSKVLSERNELVFCAIIESHVYQYRKRNGKS